VTTKMDDKAYNANSRKSVKTRQGCLVLCIVNSIHLIILWKCSIALYFFKNNNWINESLSMLEFLDDTDTTNDIYNNV
jgi:hypothetical protein